MKNILRLKKGNAHNYKPNQQLQLNIKMTGSLK